MNTPKRDIEEETCECCMVPVAHTGIHPWTVVVHLHDTAEQQKDGTKWNYMFEEHSRVSIITKQSK